MFKNKKFKTKLIVTLATSAVLSLGVAQNGYAINSEELQQQSAERFQGKGSGFVYAEEFRKKLDVVERDLIEGRIAIGNDSDASVLRRLISVREQHGEGWRDKFRFFSCIVDSVLIKYALEKYHYVIDPQQIISEVKTDLCEIIRGDLNFSEGFKGELGRKISNADVDVLGISKPLTWNDDLLQFVVDEPRIPQNEDEEEFIAYTTGHNKWKQDFKTQFPKGYEFYSKLLTDLHAPNTMLIANGHHEPNNNKITLLPGVFFANLFNDETVEEQVIIAKRTTGHELGHEIGEYFLENLLSRAINIACGPITPETIANYVKDYYFAVDFTKTFGEQWEEFALKFATSFGNIETFKSLLAIPAEEDKNYARQSFDRVVNYFESLPEIPASLEVPEVPGVFDTRLWEHSETSDAPVYLGSIRDMGRGYFQEVLADVIGLKVALFQKNTDEGYKRIAYKVLNDHFYEPRTIESGIGQDVRYPVGPYRAKAAIELYERSEHNLFP
jgi:hypothetical protein